MKESLLKDIGEFGVIERISRNIPVKRGVVVGIGDDAAVLEYNRSKYMLISSDMIIEDVHFKTDHSFKKIGRKALNVSLSDIAAMGGVPKYVTFSVGLPKSLKTENIDELIKGIKDAAQRFDVIIIGGDTNSSAKLVLETTVIGFVRKKFCMLRSGAKPGDKIYVTGSLGGSFNGRHLDFIPRVEEAQIICRSVKVNSMIDISDGLANDISHILQKSKAGAILYARNIPLHKQARSLAGALYDGEDFELLFTARAALCRGLEQKLKKKNIKITQIGEITKDKGKLELMDFRGRLSPIPLRGWKHF